jgi:ribosome-associated protein|uniref:Ribosomal silencing factor RsfS n=1 Tax=candidate division WOR-3 bacterium TaxID=2052148 RepID=A0A7C3YZL0_UNCW3
MRSPEKIVDRILTLLAEKKGEDILALNLKKLSPITDYFIIATANSSVHARSLADYLLETLKKEGELPHHIEGYGPAQWILLDYIDCVVHIFLKEVREFYGLERLWGDAPHYKKGTDD